MIEQIVESVSRAAHAGPDEVARPSVLVPYTPPDSPTIHQLVLFVKPEATDVRSGVDVTQVLRIVFGSLQEHDVTVRAVCVLAGPFLRERRIMEAHYGVINTLSRCGAEVLSESAQKAFAEVFSEQVPDRERLLGGHQFIDKHAEVSPFALSLLATNVGFTKLGSGCYCTKLTVRGRDCFVLNAFHPYQLEHYVSPGKSIVVIEIASERSVRELRQQLAGATDPHRAAVNSIRWRMAQNRQRLGLREVSINCNGIHLSAGPLEGMVEVIRFFGSTIETGELTWETTAFGQLLGREGFEPGEIRELAMNPTLKHEGQRLSAFDLTEERDARDAVNLLRAAAK